MAPKKITNVAPNLLFPTGKYCKGGPKVLRKYGSPVVESVTGVVKRIILDMDMERIFEVSVIEYRYFSLTGLVFFNPPLLSLITDTL